MASDPFQQLRLAFQKLDKQGKEDYLKGCTSQQLRLLYQHPDIFLFPKQVIEGSDWIYYLLRCGRSFGKSYAGSAWVAKKIRQGAKLIGLCGPTYDDVAKVMVPAILKWFLPDEVLDPPYNSQNHTIRFKNGAQIYCYTSDKEIRGPNLEYLWCDEICVWADGIPEKIKERFEDICRAVRVGKHPQVIITSTPKTHPFFLDFQSQIDAGNPNYRMVQGSILDNPNLPSAYVQEQIQRYGDTARGRQELFGDLIRDALGAFWTHSLIDQHRAPLPNPLDYRKPTVKLNNAQLMGLEPVPLIPKDAITLIRIVIGFDPSGSTAGDECGIIVAALYSNGQAYVLEDASGSYSPADYTKKINELYIKYKAAAVTVESNFGGKEAFLYMLRSVNATMNVKTVHTQTGKTTRAEHIASLYSQGKVHHTGSFKLLEDQMCSFTPQYSKSPDRVDALGFCLTELFWPQSHSSNGMTFTNLPAR